MTAEHDKKTFPEQKTTKKKVGKNALKKSQSKVSRVNSREFEPERKIEDLYSSLITRTYPGNIQTIPAILSNHITIVNQTFSEPTLFLWI